MRKLIAITILGALLAGCAARLPTCDGTDRRPVNASPQVRAIYFSCGATA
jgi:hypothetical protein